MIKSVSEITQTIIKLENEHQLFNWQIKGVFIWEIIRPKLFTTILVNNDTNRKLVKKGIIKKISKAALKVKNKMLRAINAIIFNPYFDRKNVDIIVFESSRKLLFKDNYIDPHTKFLYDDLVAQDLSISKYQSSFSFDKLAKRTFDIKHLDLVYFFSVIKAKFQTLNFTNDEIEKIKKIQFIFAEAFESQFNFIDLVATEIKLFKNNLIFFDTLFKKKHPKQIYIVNFCDKAAIITSAKKKKITVIDIQHGLISSEDIIYHYPSILEGSLNYFPDKFYTWSKLWSDACKIPLKKENIVVYGNKYLDNQKNNYLHIRKKENTVMIISQPGLTLQIAAMVSENKKTLQAYKVLYKLHPAEYQQAFDYKEVKALMQINNITFVNKTEDLYQLFAETQLVIGVYSTALLEAISFNCKVILFDLPGVEMMNPFIYKGIMTMFNPHQQEENIVV